MARDGRGPRTAEGYRNLIGRRVKERRKQLRLTQDGLNARLATLTGSAWNPKSQEILHLERGTRLVTDVEVLVLAKVLKTSVQWLMTGKETELTESEILVLFLPIAGDAQPRRSLSSQDKVNDEPPDSD